MDAKDEVSEFVSLFCGICGFVLLGFTFSGAVNIRIVETVHH
jgi:hypothetical protein